MNGFLWAAVVFAALGPVPCIWAVPTRPIESRDYVNAWFAVILLVACEAIAVALAVIGFAVKLF